MTEEDTPSQDIKSENSKINSNIDSKEWSLKTNSLPIDFFQVSIVTSRRILRTVMFVLPFIPISILIVQSGTLLSYTTVKRKEVAEMDRRVTDSANIVNFVSKLQKERLYMIYYILTPNRNNNNDSKLIFIDTDESLLGIRKWPKNDAGNKLFSSKIRFQIRLDDFREDIITNYLESSNDTLIKTLKFYNFASNYFLKAVSDRIKQSTRTYTWRYLLAFINLLNGIENKIIADIYCMIFYSTKTLHNIEWVNFVMHYTLGQEYFKQARNLIYKLDITFSKYKNMSYYKTYTKGINDTLNGNINEYQNKTDAFHEAAEVQTTLLKAMQKQIELDLKEITKSEVNGTLNQQIKAIVILILILCVSPIIILLIKNADSGLLLFMKSVNIKAKELSKEKKKTQKLLYKMLPPEIVVQLQKNQNISQAYDSVTVFFSELNGFDDVARNSLPIEIISLLNSLHTVSDFYMDQYNVYKVETIKDQYMVVSGIPVKNGDLHAGEIAKMALTLNKIIGSTNFLNKYRFQLQSGIHTGPCVAGIVGTKMPRYCLFGDTINTASRMQSQGTPGNIHITYETKMILTTLGGFTTKLRGSIEIKGKGTLETYWLIDSSNQLSTQPNILHRIKDKKLEKIKELLD